MSTPPTTDFAHYLIQSSLEHYNANVTVFLFVSWETYHRYKRLMTIRCTAPIHLLAAWQPRPQHKSLRNKSMRRWVSCGHIPLATHCSFIQVAHNGRVLHLEALRSRERQTSGGYKAAIRMTAKTILRLFLVWGKLQMCLESQEPFSAPKGKVDYGKAKGCTAVSENCRYRPGFNSHFSTVL